MGSTPTRRLDPDAAAMTGCTVFVAASFTCLILAVVPWLFFPHQERVSDLARCLILGLVPDLVLGAFICRRWGCAGAGGFGGGMMASALFLALRLDQVRLAALANRIPDLEYPRIVGWLLPLAWLLLAAIVTVISLPKKELLSDESRKQP